MGGVGLSFLSFYGGQQFAVHLHDPHHRVDSLYHKVSTGFLALSHFSSLFPADDCINR